MLLPVYVALLGGERLVHALREKRAWNNRDAAANIAITLAYFAVDVAVGAIVPLAAMAWLFEHARVFTLGHGVVGWLVAFLLYDLTWYVDHRIGHRTAFFWAMHHVHHSSNEYNMTVASRGFVIDKTLLPRPLFYLLPVLGVSPLQFIGVMMVTNVWGIAQHTRLVGKLGVLDAIFATPSNHRVHHGSDPKYLDRNYGEVLIIWDRLLGTYQREEEEPTYGVTDRLDSYNPVTIEFAGLRWLRRRVAAAPGWRAKLACLVLPPGVDVAAQSPPPEEAPGPVGQNA